MKITLIKDGSTFIPYSEDDEEKAKAFSNAIYEADIKNMDIRTIKQNSALHKLFDLTAYALNEAGITVQVLLNNKREAKVKKAFEWAKCKLEKIPKADMVLDKLYDFIIGAESTDLPWTMLKVKDLLWRELQIHVTNKTSTTKLTKKEIDEVYEVFNLVLSRYGVHIPFPSRELWEEK